MVKNSRIKIRNPETAEPIFDNSERRSLSVVNPDATKHMNTSRADPPKSMNPKMFFGVRECGRFIVAPAIDAIRVPTLRPSVKKVAGAKYLRYCGSIPRIWRKNPTRVAIPVMIVKAVIVVSVSRTVLTSRLVAITIVGVAFSSSRMLSRFNYSILAFFLSGFLKGFYNLPILYKYPRNGCAPFSEFSGYFSLALKP